MANVPPQPKHTPTLFNWLLLQILRHREKVIYVLCCFYYTLVVQDTSIDIPICLWYDTREKKLQQYCFSKPPIITVLEELVITIVLNRQQPQANLYHKFVNASEQQQLPAPTAVSHAQNVPPPFLPAPNTCLCPFLLSSSSQTPQTSSSSQGGTAQDSSSNT